MPKPYVNQRRQAEMVPELMAQLAGLGDVVTYLLVQAGGTASISRDELKRINEQVFVSTKSGPDDETIELTLEKMPQ